MRTNIHLIQLLDVIRRGSSIQPLVRQGLEYAQIADLLEQAKRARLLKEDPNDALALTDDGEVLLQSLRTRIPRKRGAWIQPLEELRTVQVSKDVIYLPVDAP